MPFLYILDGYICLSVHKILKLKIEFLKGKSFKGYSTIHSDLTMMILYERIPEPIFLRYKSLSEERKTWKTWQKMTEEEIWFNLCVCIFSSNVPYELAVSASNHLWQNSFLDLNWLGRTIDAKDRVSEELSKPIYLPPKKDGSLRKYRFPHIRSRDVVMSAREIISQNINFKTLLARSDSSKNVRKFLIEHIFGFGLKQATHFLRNIGYCNSLAIIDSHVISFLRCITDPPLGSIQTVSPKKYFELEQILQEIAKNLKIDLSLFDMAIWEYMRQSGVRIG